MIDQNQFNCDVAAGGQPAGLALYRLSELVAGRTTDDPDLAGDLTQSIWIHLREDVLPKLQPDGNAWSYCFAAAQRKAWKLAKREQQHRAAGHDPDEPVLDVADGSPTPDEIVANRELVAPVIRSRDFRGLIGVAQSSEMFSHEGNGRFVAQRAGRQLRRSKKNMASLLDRARKAVIAQRPPGKCLLAQAVVAIDHSGEAREFPSYKAAWKSLGIDKRNVRACLSGQRQTAGGFRFAWADDFDRNAVARATSAHAEAATSRGCTPTAA